MNPRRSSRHTNSQPPSAPQPASSSASSITSSRAERNTRSHHKFPSPRRSVLPRSQSLEDLDPATKSQSRQVKGRQEDQKDDTANVFDDEEDEEAEEEEVTRCICGLQEYPGLPAAIVDAAKAGSRDNGEPNSTALPSDLVLEFIQCDTCKVWQHGGCVGIPYDSQNPDEYFCEQCRKDLHQVNIASNGQKYSQYLPVHEATSAQASPDSAAQNKGSKRAKDSKGSRLGSENLAGKRRSTMNSRDAAYDEAEQLRRAIEESKKEGGAESIDLSTRRRKRSRSESDERKEGTKRQRTTSDSSSSITQGKTSPQNGGSEHENPSVVKPVEGNHKKIRGAAGRNHRERDFRDHEEKRERERADAAGRRKGRAERRRGDDSDPSEEPVSRTTSLKGPDVTGHPPFLSQPVPSSPIPPPDKVTPKASHKKTGRPPARRGRIGRNQYTKDRDLLPSVLNPNDADNSPARSNSREEEDTPHVNGNTNGAGECGKPSKPRHMNPNRTTMNDMKRRVAGILEFISHTQVELAGEERGRTSPLGGINHGNENQAREVNESKKDEAGGRETEAPAKEPAKGPVERVKNGRGGTLGEKDFKGLNSLEMMEALTRRLMLWQAEYGKWGEK